MNQQLSRIAKKFISVIYLLTMISAVHDVSAQASAPREEQIYVDGNVPDEAARGALIQRLRTGFGAHRIVDRMQVGGVVAPPNWSNTVQKILELPQLHEIHKGQLQIEGHQVSLVGEVANEALRQEVVSKVAETLGPGFVLKNRLRVATSQQTMVDDALANRTIEFESGSARLTVAGQGVLNELVPVLKKLAGKRFVVVGHTDAKGNRAANIALSKDRADTVKAFLVEHGVTAAQISTSGAGPDEPVASNDTPEGQAKNRRIEFRVEE